MKSNSPNIDWQIPLSDLAFDHQETAAVLEVLQSKWLSMGQQVLAFEQEFSQAFNLPFCLAVANGTAALHLAMLACGISSGDEIIQPALNFVSTANMTRQCSAVPVFADILSLENPIMDPSKVASLVTSKTKAVVTMHYGGHIRYHKDIEEICRKHGLWLLEDSCHALGATDEDGRYAGNIGDFGTFSFFSNKNMATGEGGIISMKSEEHFQKVKLLRSHGMSSMSWDRHKGHAQSYTVTVNGFNYRPNELMGALGRAQLRKLPTMNLHRRALFEYYCKLLKGSDWIVPLADNQHSSHHLMVVVAPDVDRKLQASARLRDARIQTSMHYPCIADFDVFREWSRELPITREFVSRAITLPLFPSMTLAQVDQVVRTLKAES